MKVFIKDSFDAAHFLPKVPDGHKCRNMHGHTYRVQIVVTGKVDSCLGWVEDYSDIKARWEPVKRLLDHQIINQVLQNPTCENIASFIGVRVAADMVELQETENCGCIWERNEHTT